MIAPENQTALLAGVRVVDLSQYVPGPYATRLMADLGADVIKVEPPGGEPMRRLMNQDGSSVSVLYNHLNRGKRILFVDLKSSSGQGQFSQLISQADVLLDGYRPGMLSKLGFSADSLRSLNGGLIHCSLSGFGVSGPDAMKAGHDLGYCAVAGMFSNTTSEGRSPQIPFPPLADHVGSLQAMNAILAALVSRARNNRGCHLDVSLYESVLSWQYFSGAPEVTDLLSGGAAYYNIYPTKDDRFITLGAIERKFWANFCRGIKRSEWIPRYDDALPQKALKRDVAMILKSGTLSEWQIALSKLDCCFEPIPENKDVFAHRQTSARGLFTESGFSYPAVINHFATPQNSLFVDYFSLSECHWYSRN